jgi:hypothetical protein
LIGTGTSPVNTASTGDDVGSTGDEEGATVGALGSEDTVGIGDTVGVIGTIVGKGVAKLGDFVSVVGDTELDGAGEAVGSMGARVVVGEDDTSTGEEDTGEGVVGGTGGKVSVTTPVGMLLTVLTGEADGSFDSAVTLGEGFKVGASVATTGAFVGLLDDG